jgi:histidyl-tRNA synthetase
MKEKLSTQPYKGARDFYPEDMRIRNYIFDTWKRVCRSYGYEEYDFPIIEPFEVFAAKTGEEIVNEQMYNFEDRGGRRLAVRPELTPGTVRMLAGKYKELQKPVKWFMVGNNWRAEKPQLGRGREFYQLEVNIFGIKGVMAEFEIFSTAISILKAFGADETMFELAYSDRKLIKALLVEMLKLDEDTATKTRRLMDKKAKMENKDFDKALEDIGLDNGQIDKVNKFMGASIDQLENVFTKEIVENNEGYKAIKELSELLASQGLDKYCKFDPSIIRGFDYSDGLVYEVYDKNPDNNRSMFGGERFDGLVEIFGDFDLPGTGYAMGDWTLIEFLKGWDLLPELSTETQYLVTLWQDDDPKYLNATQEIAQKLRDEGNNVSVWLEPDTKLDKQLKYADRKGIPNVVIIGEQELANETYTVKDMKTGNQETINY